MSVRAKHRFNGFFASNLAAAEKKEELLNKMEKLRNKVKKLRNKVSFEPELVGKLKQLEQQLMNILSQVSRLQGVPPNTEPIIEKELIYIEKILSNIESDIEKRSFDISDILKRLNECFDRLQKILKLFPNIIIIKERAPERYIEEEKRGRPSWSSVVPGGLKERVLAQEAKPPPGESDMRSKAQGAGLPPGEPDILLRRNVVEEGVPFSVDVVVLNPLGEPIFNVSVKLKLFDGRTVGKFFEKVENEVSFPLSFDKGLKAGEYKIKATLEYVVRSVPKRVEKELTIYVKRGP